MCDLPFAGATARGSLPPDWKGARPPLLRLQRGLGQFRDDPASLRAAGIYVEAAQQRDDLRIASSQGRRRRAAVAETDSVLAFHHTRPYWPAHVVVIPKVHVLSLTDLGEHEHLLPGLLAVVRDVARSVEAEHGACRVLTNLGAYQDAKHLHFHVSSGAQMRW